MNQIMLFLMSRPYSGPAMSLLGSTKQCAHYLAFLHVTFVPSNHVLACHALVNLDALPS